MKYHSQGLSLLVAIVSKDYYGHTVLYRAQGKSNWNAHYCKFLKVVTEMSPQNTDFRLNTFFFK